MTELFNTLLYKPLFNATILLYNLVPGNDFGLAVITLTTIIRLAFFPLTLKTLRSQKALSRINPQVSAIKEKFKNDMQAQSAAIMNLYKENKVNPMSGCLPLLIQLPILIALYKAFGAGFKPENLTLLYSFVSNPVSINPVSFGFLDITVRSIPLAIITGVVQYFQLSQNQKIMSGNNPKTGTLPANDFQALNKQMLYFFPVMIIIIGWNLPAGLVVYWLATTLFSVAEQAYLRRTSKE
jgi:YidC/Oxa1 family membrane protein insertase